MDQNSTVTELRAKIAKYRALARFTTDRETVVRIEGLVVELEFQLRELEHRSICAAI